MDATIADQRGLSSSRICTGTRGSGRRSARPGNGLESGLERDRREKEERVKAGQMMRGEPMLKLGLSRGVAAYRRQDPSKC